MAVEQIEIHYKEVTLKRGDNWLVLTEEGYLLEVCDTKDQARAVTDELFAQNIYKTLKVARVII